MDVKLSIEFLNQLCGYLGTRPYQEVAQFILAIQQAASAPPIEEPKKPSK
jgi:hypothetical protein